METFIILFILNYFLQDYSITLINIICLVVGFFVELLSEGEDKDVHPVILYGWIIEFMDRKFNRGYNLFFKGMAITVFLVIINFYLLLVISIFAYKIGYYFLFAAFIVYYGIATKQLVTSVYNVFLALEGKKINTFNINKNWEVTDKETNDYSIEYARRYLSYIVSRDTSKLNEKDIKLSALESLAENLSDGVIAPMFYFALFGVPGIMTYKLINTLDSMIGYKNEKYMQFGKFAAKLDDIVNYMPARLTAFLLAFVGMSWKAIKFIFKFGKKHSSPNSGYPEAAMAGILNCRFGGKFVYHGNVVEKPFIGENDRDITEIDIKYAINLVLVSSTLFMILLTSIKMLL